MNFTTCYFLVKNTLLMVVTKNQMVTTLLPLDSMIRRQTEGTARHETINGLFKIDRALRDMWQHDREKHSPMFHFIANIVQLGLREGNHAFAIDYDEAEFGDFDFGYDDH